MSKEMKTWFVKILTFIVLTGMFGCKKSENPEPDKTINNITIAGVYPDSTKHVDFNPDILIEQGYFPLDPDHNGKNDLIFWAVDFVKPYYTWLWSYLDILDTAVQVATTTDTLNPFCFNKGDTINNYKYWKSKLPYLRSGITYDTTQLHVSLVFCEKNSPSGPYSSYWKERIGYIGIRIRGSDGKYTYGWVKVGVEYFCEMTVYEYYFY